MSGIAFLLLFVVFAIVHATNLYSKGVAIRQINQVGRQVSDELGREIRYGGNPNLPTGPTVKNRICVGTKSYVWNTAAEPDFNKKADGTPVGLVRLDSAGYCDATSPAIPNSTQEMLGNVVQLMDMKIVRSAIDTDVYKVTMVFGTATEPPVYSGGIFQCPEIGGQYCAVGEFESIIYARGQ